MYKCRWYTREILLYLNEKGLLYKKMSKYNITYNFIQLHNLYFNTYLHENCVD